MSGGKRRIFPEACKREAVDRVSRSGLPPAKVALELGLHETVSRRWMNRFAPVSGIASVPQQQRVQPGLLLVADLTAENSRLQRKHKRLWMEREIIKTVTIFGAGAKMKLLFIQGELLCLVSTLHVRGAGDFGQRLLRIGAIARKAGAPQPTGSCSEKFEEFISRVSGPTDRRVFMRCCTAPASVWDVAAWRR